MPLFRRKAKPVPPPDMTMPAGEEIERSIRATLLQGKQPFEGALHLTTRRLIFEAKRADARWMIVPFDEVKAAGLYPAPGGTMGAPASRRQCLLVETTKGEQVWWDFDERAEREWLPLVQARIAVRATEDDGA